MNWQIDSAHSDITFSVRHMMISKVRGRFTDFSGTINFDEDTPANTSVHVEIDAASIDTQEEDRDTHLRSADFLNVETHPKLIFVGKEVKQTGSDKGKLIGDLTISGVTKEVVLDVEYAGQAKSPWGTYSAGFYGSTEINRKDFGLTWNQTLETGGILVGDKVKIEIDLEIVKQTEAETESEEEAVTA
ncbi:MAG: YceI family protein [Chloroflexota bacterium]|jgi:polyisoprenoid-binding protein YceI